MKNIEELVNEWYKRWIKIDEDSSIEELDQVDYLSEKICLLVAEKYIDDVKRNYE